MKYKKRDSGLGLIEVVVAFSILLLVMIPILELTRGIMKAGGGFFKKYGQRGNIGAVGGSNTPIDMVDASLISEEELLENFIRNVKKLGYDDAPKYIGSNGYLGLKSLAADSPNATKGRYEYILNWEALGGTKCALTSVAGEFFLTQKSGMGNAINVAYQNPGGIPLVHSCYTYFGERDLNGAVITMNITNGAMINMPALNAIWNPTTQKGNANISLYSGVSSYSYVKIRPNPEFIFIEVETDGGKKRNVIVTPLENYCLNLT